MSYHVDHLHRLSTRNWAQVCEESGVPSIFSRFEPTLLSQKMAVTWIIADLLVFAIRYRIWHKCAKSEQLTITLEIRHKVKSRAWHSYFQI